MSLLIAELAFEDDSLEAKAAKIGVLAASLVAALLAVIALRLRALSSGALHETVERAEDQDGIPDVYNENRGLT